MWRAAPALAVIIAGAIALAASSAPRTGFEPIIHGMALPPYFEDPALGISFDKAVDEIADLGANHMSVIVQWGQPDIRRNELAPYRGETQDDNVVRRIIRNARAAGLRSMLFPIVWIENRKIGEWRGTLAPTDEAAWWASYCRFILHYARLAETEAVEIFSVGSELATFEHQTERWRDLIVEVRKVYRGQLIYSANWDHYEDIEFWPALDLVGLTAYYRLTEHHDASADELVASWKRIRVELRRWSARIGRPFVFTEVGYPSLDGGASAPWDYTRAGGVDLEEQRLAFEAFFTAWHGEPTLRGVFFWNWFGPGGPSDTYYTPRGKPAESVIRRWYRTPWPGQGRHESTAGTENWTGELN